MRMQTLEYAARFTTPAFLGNADQSGQWRTPPFKALLRQWWRVVWAAKNRYPDDVAAMRRDEGRLLGNAWVRDEYRQSTVRLRLSHWTAGALTSWNGLEQPPVRHPEVQRTSREVGPHAYLGYGPLDGRGGTKFAEKKGENKSNAAIRAGETATLSIAAPCENIDDIRAALALIDAYGAAGGRCRNGWGSLSLVPANGSPEDATDLTRWSRPWQEALAVDWPHAVGRDEAGALVWQTAKAYDDWKTLMRDLAIIKIGLRTMFVFPDTGPPHRQPVDRHWLSYPITNHATRQWSHDKRLSNSLRFKVRPDAQHPGRLRGVIVHVPCLPPRKFDPHRETVERVWTRSHQLLDELGQPTGSRDYRMVDNPRRRNDLKPQLDTIKLERIPQ